MFLLVFRNKLFPDKSKADKFIKNNNKKEYISDDEIDDDDLD